MPDRRHSRFLAEVAFLVALAAGVTIAELGGLEIAGIMLLGWAIVAAVEWAAWRDTPHYGQGLPPRYYVPRVSLPPPQALEQVAVGYPTAQRDEAPTWIASAELRAELLGEWPVAAAVQRVEDAGTGEDTQEEAPEARADGWVLPAEPVEAPSALVELPPAAVELPPAPVEPEPEPKPESGPESEPESTHEPAEAAAAGAAPASPLSRYSLDPLADEPEHKRFGRRTRVEDAPAIDVPTRAAGARALPRQPSPPAE